MERLARIVACVTVAAVIAGCQANGAAPPPLAIAAKTRFLPPIAFQPIGPTHMSDGLPTSGKVNAYAVDPANPHIIYVASGRGTGLETYSSAGVFRTINGGARWEAIDNGLTDPSGAISSVVNALWIDPARPSILLAASEYDGIFRSEDGGSTWHIAYRTSRATEFAQFDGVMYAATATGILASTDDGRSWSLSLAGSARRTPTALAATAGTSGSALYAGMSDGSVYAFGKRGWTKVGRLPYDASTGTQGSTPAVHQIAIDPMTPTTLYASANDGSWDQNLHASVDGGKTWNGVLAKRYARLGLGTQAIGFSAVHPHRLYLGTDGGFYYFTADGSPSPQVRYAANLSVIDVRNVWALANGGDDACWVASDQGLDYEPTCSQFFTKFNDRVVTSTTATGLARRFIVSPNGKTVLTSLQDFDSHRTFDGGRTWSRAYALYEDGFNELRPGDPTRCYAYDEVSGLSVSVDGCARYRFTGYQQGIFSSRLMTTPLAFDPKEPKRMYVMAGPITFGAAKVGAFVTSDDGATFQRLPWPFARPGMILVDPANRDHMLVGDLRGGRSSISVTMDGGTTWMAAAGVPATAFWYAATISAANPQIVLASNIDAANNVFVLRSTDGGRHFTKVATVVNAPLIRGRADIERRPEDDATPAAFVYAPAREIRFNQDVTKGVPYVALTTLRGAYVSSDLGTTWQRVDRALIAHSFWGIRWRAGYLYLGSDGQGIVVSTAPLQ